MKKCKEFIFIFKDIQDIIITVLIGLLLHIFLGIKNGNLLVSIITGFNTSIYSQLIVISCALYIENIAKMWIEEVRRKNLWASLFFKIITSNLVLLTVFSVYKSVYVETLILDVLMYIIAVIIGQIIERIIQEKIEITSTNEEIFKYINILIVITLVFSLLIGGI